MLRLNERLRLLDLIFKRQWPNMIVEKSQDEKPKKPGNDSVQVQDKRVGSHSVYTVCTNMTRIPQGKTKLGGLGRSRKKEVSELRQTGENKPRKCGCSQVAH